MVTIERWQDTAFTCTGLHSRGMIRMPILAPVQRQMRLKWACGHEKWILEQWKKVVWSMGRRHDSGSSVMVYSLFYWETLSSGFYMVLICTFYLNTVADQGHPFIAMVFSHLRWGSPIHGGPNLQLTGLKDFTSNVLGPDTPAHLQKTSHVLELFWRHMGDLENNVMAGV